MSAIAFHGARGSDGRAGKPYGGRMLSSRDPIAVAKAAKLLVQSGKWRTLPGRDDRARILLAVKSSLPFAFQVGLPVDALVALGKEPGEGCHWCAALIQRAPDEPELERNEVTTALLGEGCERCQYRWTVAEVARQEKEHTARLVAAGFRPAAAGRLRTDEEISRYTASLRALDNAKLPPRPRSSWPPSSLQAAGHRRPSDPPYFQRQPIRWPADARRPR